MRLRTQIAILAGGMFLIPIIVSAGGYFLMSLLSAEREPGDDYIATVRWVRNDLPALLDSLDPSALEKGIPDDVKIAVFGTDNRVVFSTIPRVRKGTVPSLAELFGYARTSSSRSHVQWEPVRTADGRRQVVMIEFPRRSGRPDFRARIMLPVVVTASCLLVFAVLTSVIIIRSLTGSVTNLEHATRRLADGDLDFELTAKGNSEIASLTRNFEMMRRALKDEYARRARFIMGVSHDLKTPLSLIEGYAEAIADGLASEPKEHDRYIRVIRDKARLLEGMVNQLIGFAKLETAEWKLSHEPV
ncbi:histidine kinase dimerization/phospho-acceptor domain-containing protein, partial [Salinispira pacifica]